MLNLIGRAFGFLGLLFIIGFLVVVVTGCASPAQRGDRATTINHTTYNGSAGMVCYPMNGKQTCYRQGN